MNRILMAGALLLCFTPFLIAQASAEDASPVVNGAPRGAYGLAISSGSKDSVNGYSTQLTGALGYDITPRISVEVGIPYYPLASSEVTSSTVSSSGQTTSTSQTSSTNLLGDLYFRLALNLASERWLLYQGTVKATAPTGDTASGIGTGSATWNWFNHLEIGTGRAAPYVEAGVGNSLADSTKYHRSYTTLGYVAPFAAGLLFDMGHNLSFDASTYYDLPFGEQKLYSRVVRSGVTVPGGTRRGGRRPIGSQFFSQGGSSLTEDHGYNGSLAFSPTKRVLLSVNYNRSIPDALDAVSATLSVRFGHMTGKAGQSER